MSRPRLGSGRSVSAIVRVRAGPLSLLALSDPGPRLALRMPGRFLVLTTAPNGTPHAYEAPAPKGWPEDAVPLCGEALDAERLHVLVEGLAGGGIGIASLADIAESAGTDPADASALAAAVPGLLSRAGFAPRFTAAMAAVRMLAHTGADQRRLLFSDDPGSDGLRELCLAQPYLAETHWGEAVRAAEAGRDPLAAATAASGLAPAVLRRLHGVPASDFVTARLAPSPSYLAGLLAAVPPEWIPGDRGQRRSFSLLADALPRVVHRTGVPLARLVSSCKGDWTGLLDRCLALASEGMEEPRPLHAALSDIEDFPRHFADRVVGPLAARAGIGELDRIGPHARRLAGRAVYADRTVVSILEMSRRWHARQDRIDAACPDLVPDDLNWPPLAPPRDHGDLRVVPLCNGRQIVDEGSDGLDASGVRGLSHCVGSYRGQARRGECHILSVRRMLPDGGYVRLATAEVVLSASGAADVRQVRGLRNAPAPPEAEAALAAFCAGGFEPRPPTVDTADPVSRRAGYDWRDDDAIARAVSAFQCVLPRRLRNLAADALWEALGGPSRPGDPEPASAYAP